MKKLLSVVMVAFAVLAMSQSAQARIFSFGPKVGINVNSMHFNKSLLDSDNRCGYNFGATAEVMIPVASLGVDFSLMYVRRNSKFLAEINNQEASANSHRDYFEIPVNLKWKIPVPAISGIVQPYLFTGPSFSFLTSKKVFNQFEQQVKNKSMDVAWNFGFGVQILKRVQVGASYGIGMTKALEFANVAGQTQKIDGKNRYWTVTAAYMFGL